MASNPSSGTTEWGNEVMPGVFLTRRSGSAAEAANKTGLGILSNTLAFDGSTIDFRKVHARIKERRSLVKKLEESNAYMVKYLRKERRRRERRDVEINDNQHPHPPTKLSADSDDDETDLLPITPEEDDRVIEESILENELIIKDCKHELDILLEMVAVQKCLQSGNANEGTPNAQSDRGPVDDDADDGTEESEEDEADDEEEEEEEGYGEDDNQPFDEDVTGVVQTSEAASGRFAL